MSRKSKSNTATEGSEAIIAPGTEVATIAEQPVAEAAPKVVEATVLPADSPMTLAIRWLSAMARTIIGRVSAATGVPEDRILSDILIGYPPSNAAVAALNIKGDTKAPALYYTMTPGKHNRLAVDAMTRGKVWLHPSLSTPANLTATLYVALLTIAFPPVAYVVEKGDDKGKTRWRSSEKQARFREALNALGFAEDTDAPKIIKAGNLLERDIKEAIGRVTAECGEYPAEAVNALFDAPILKAARNVVVYCPLNGIATDDESKPSKDNTHLILRMTSAEALVAGLTDVPQMGKDATTPFPCPKCLKATGAAVPLTTYLDELQVREWTKAEETRDATQGISDQSAAAVAAAGHTIDEQLGALKTVGAIQPGDAIPGV